MSRTVTRRDAQNLVNEETKSIRTRNDYFHCVINSTFGIKEDCIFNKIHDFHISKNMSIDPMHDLPEGICRYNIAKILNNFIYVEQLCTLEVFNEILLNCISSFDDNVPPPFNSKSINPKKWLLRFLKCII